MIYWHKLHHEWYISARRIQKSGCTDHLATNSSIHTPAQEVVPVQTLLFGKHCHHDQRVEINAFAEHPEVVAAQHVLMKELQHFAAYLLDKWEKVTHLTSILHLSRQRQMLLLGYKKVKGNKNSQFFLVFGVLFQHLSVRGILNFYKWDELKELNEINKLKLNPSQSRIMIKTLQKAPKNKKFLQNSVIWWVF